MMVVFPLIFVAETKLIYGYNFVVYLKGKKFQKRPEGTKFGTTENLHTNV